MAEVKSITVHGETYDIKDETARNSINTLNESVSTLQTHDTQHTEQITTLQSSVSNNTDDIGTIQENLGSVTSRVTAAEGNISTLATQTSANTASINSLDKRTGTNETDISELETQMATKITGDWFFDNRIPMTDQVIKKTPDYTVIDFGTENLSPGYYLVTITNILLQGGTGNIEIAFLDNAVGTLVGNVPANENIHYANCTGVVAIPEGTNSVGIGLRGTHDTPGVLKSYSAIYLTLVKIKNL